MKNWGKFKFQYVEYFKKNILEGYQCYSQFLADVMEETGFFIFWYLEGGVPSLRCAVKRILAVAIHRLLCITHRWLYTIH